jgi:hypothetical protein
MNKPIRLSLLASLAFLGAACNGTETPTPQGTGGTTTSGGAATTGGETSSGGGSTGGAASGGTSTGGTAVSTGGTVTSTGGKATGGTSAGGTASGGKASGGTSAGGSTSTTGGSSGTCVESTCGSHKWACWKVPTPPTSSAPNHQSLTDLGNGAARDNITCLVWEKANPSTQGNWQASSDRCAALASSNYAGFNDWRLPTRMEMASIADLHGSNGYPSVFTVTSGYYTTWSPWQETITGVSSSGFIWGYGTNGFTSNAIAGSGTNLVARCVRGNGTGEAFMTLATEPPNHYTINATGEVTDNYTGLIWQQGFTDPMAHADAVTYCSTLSLNGHTGWRVPQLGELASTVNEAKVGNATVATAFPGNPNGCKGPNYWFWAMETYYSGGGANFWGLSYCDGFTGGNVGASGAWNDFPTARVRCVR